MTRPRPLDPRWVAEQFARETERLGTTCKLWLTWEAGAFCWWWQPARPTGRSARAYVEVAELEPENAAKLLDARDGWWSMSHLARFLP